MADKPINVNGGCLCGEIRYEVQALLRSAYICHCRICQKSTGQPAEIAVPIKAGTLKFIKGAPRFYASSAHGRRAFCGACGSRLAWQALDPENDWLSSVNVGSLDNPAEVLAECHIFADLQLPWYRVNESLPKYKEGDGDALLKKWHEERAGGSAQDWSALAQSRHESGQGRGAGVLGGRDLPGISIRGVSDHPVQHVERITPGTRPPRRRMPGRPSSPSRD